MKRAVAASSFESEDVFEAYMVTIDLQKFKQNTEEAEKTTDFTFRLKVVDKPTPTSKMLWP